MLEELGLGFKHVATDPAKGESRVAEFLALNPAGKVPVLVDGDFVLTESIAINHYLADLQPSPLVTDDAQSRAKIMQWSSWAVSEMEVPFTYVIREKRTAAIAGRPEDEAGIVSLLNAARETLAVIEAMPSNYLLGEAFSLADLNVATAAMIAPMFLDMTAFPIASAWLERCLSRPSWSRVAKYS
jgi:glutathione S-transferase